MPGPWSRTGFTGPKGRIPAGPAGRPAAVQDTAAADRRGRQNRDPARPVQAGEPPANAPATRLRPDARPFPAGGTRLGRGPGTRTACDFEARPFPSFTRNQPEPLEHGWAPILDIQAAGRGQRPARAISPSSSTASPQPRRPSWRSAPALVTLRAGTLQLSFGVLCAGLKPGAGVFGRRDPGFEGRSQLGLVPRGVLADLDHLPVRGLAAPVQLRAGRLGSLPRPGRVLPGGPGPGLGRRHPLLGSPPGLGNLPASASCSAAALAATAPASSASACSAAARASPASASARARRRQNANHGRPGSSGPAAPPPCRASSCRCRNAVSAVCGSPVTGSGSPQYPGSAPASPGRGSFSQPGYAHLRTPCLVLTIGRPRSPLTSTA